MDAMRSTNDYSSAAHGAAMPGLSLMLVLCVAILLLSGCSSYGPIGTPDFDPTYSRTLDDDEQLLFSSPTELVDGTFMEGEMAGYASYEGVLLLTDKRVLFAEWNKKQQRYEPALWTGYANIAQLKMHNNILMQYIAIVATDGSKFSFMLGKQSVDPAYAILMKHI
jgi:hypothetical protein